MTENGICCPWCEEANERPDSEDDVIECTCGERFTILDAQIECVRNLFWDGGARIVGMLECGAGSDDIVAEIDKLAQWAKEAIDGYINAE